MAVFKDCLLSHSCYMKLFNIKWSSTNIFLANLRLICIVTMLLNKGHLIPQKKLKKASPLQLYGLLAITSLLVFSFFCRKPRKLERRMMTAQSWSLCVTSHCLMSRESMTYSKNNCNWETHKKDLNCTIFGLDLTWSKTVHESLAVLIKQIINKLC